METKLTDFMRSTAKVCLAVFVAFLGLGVLGGFATWAYTSYAQREAKVYEEVKGWEVDLSDNLKLKLKARTKVVAGRLLTSVQFMGYPSYLSLPVNQSGSFTLIFLDNDGFKVYSKSLKLEDFTSVVGSDGAKIGLDAQVEDFIAVEDYKRFGRLTVEWNLLTQAAATAEQIPELAVSDHCAPSLSRSERLRRLARHGTVRQNGDSEYSAGNRTVAFSYDGSLLYCR